MNPSLNSVGHLMSTYGLHGASVRKPSAIRKLCETDPLQTPQAEILSIREFDLNPNTVTPVHWHPRGKEKVYCHRGVGGDVVEIFIFISIRNGWQSYRLSPHGMPVVIPPRAPHALYCAGGATLLVIASSQDIDDIQWEEGY